MGPMAHRLEGCAKNCSIALVSILGLASGALSQVSSNDNASQPAAVRAPLLTYGVDAGIGESDNVTLASTDKVSQTMAIADVDFTVKEQSRLLDANAKGDFSYLDYLQNAYGNQLLGRFDGTANASLVPERLTWAVRDDFGQAALDPFTPVVPTNLENVNYFSTGPTLSLRPGGINFVDLSAQYARTQFQTSPFNSNRLIGTLAAGRDISAGAAISLNANTERVLFANTVLNSDFDRTSGFARYEVHGARTDITADFGASVIEQSGASSSGALVRLQLKRKLSPAAAIQLMAGRELTDAGSSFSNQQSGASGVIGNVPAAQTANNYTREYASATWTYVRNRTTIAVTGRWEKDTYPGQPSLDLNMPGAEFSVERRLTRALTAQLSGRFSKSDYANADVATATASSDYTSELIGGSLIWRGGRGLEIKLRYAHNSWVATGPDSGYRENRAFLTVGYRPYSTPPADETL